MKSSKNIFLLLLKLMKRHLAFDVNTKADSTVKRYQIVQGKYDNYQTITEYWFVASHTPPQSPAPLCTARLCQYVLWPELPLRVAQY